MATTSSIAVQHANGTVSQGRRHLGRIPVACWPAAEPALQYAGEGRSAGCVGRYQLAGSQHGEARGPHFHPSG